MKQYIAFFIIALFVTVFYFIPKGIEQIKHRYRS